MDEMDPTVKAALDTILWFEDSLMEVEAKTGELIHVLEKHDIDPEPVYEIFKVFSQLRFHMAEAHEYQALLDNRQNKKTSRQGAFAPEQEQSLQSQAAADSPQAPRQIPLHKRVESRLASLIKGSFLPLRKSIPQQPPLV